MESNGMLPHLFIPSKTATLVPEFAVEDLLLDRNEALVPEFAVYLKVSVSIRDAELHSSIHCFHITDPTLLRRT